jgi:hypothetical protein
MNKEKLVQLFSEALEKNVAINLHFSQFQQQGDEKYHPVSKEDAQKLATRFAEAIGTSDIQHNVCQPSADDFLIDYRNFRVSCCYVPTEEEEISGKRKRIEELEKELAKLKNVQ